MAEKENFEKLHVGKYANTDVMYAALRTSEGEMVAAITSTPYDGNKTAVRRLNRMMRCWHEYDEIKTEYLALRHGVFKVNIRPLQNQITKLKVEKNELLDALKKARKQMLIGGIKHDNAHIYNEIDQCIKKAEES